jgi:hypothetical protein
MKVKYKIGNHVVLDSGHSYEAFSIMKNKEYFNLENVGIYPTYRSPSGLKALIREVKEFHIENGNIKRL